MWKREKQTGALFCITEKSGVWREPEKSVLNGATQTRHTLISVELTAKPRRNNDGSIYYDRLVCLPFGFYLIRRMDHPSMQVPVYRNHHYDRRNRGKLWIISVRCIYSGSSYLGIQICCYHRNTRVYSRHKSIQKIRNYRRLNT